MDKILGKVPMGEKIGYSLGDAAANLVFQMMMIYQLKFYTDVFGLEGAIAGTVLLIARIVDAFVDPAAGILSDKTQTKWGKFRPWVIWTALPFMVFYVLAFYNPGIENKALVAVYDGRYEGAYEHYFYSFCSCYRGSVRGARAYASFGS